jgi:putative membrane protein
MRKLTTTCLAAGLIGLVAGQASAAVSSVDRSFATKAASGGLAEIQAAQVAQQKAGSPQVKTFADRMISDHTQANTELQQIAQQEKLTLPTQPASHDRASVQAMTGLTGSVFDRRYAQEEVRDHQQDVALFRQEANSGRDPALKQYAQKTLPVLRQHLQMAQALTNPNSRQ